MLSDILRMYKAVPVSGYEVYRDIFRLGEHYIQRYNGESRNLKANPLVYYKQDNHRTGHYRILFEDEFADILAEIQQADFTLINGLSYFGRRNTIQNASKMYAIIFDLDGQTDETLTAFMSGATTEKYKIYPCPNYIILSGHGIHLYYTFIEPISLYPYSKLQLKELKYALIEKIWNPYTSTIKTPQYQGINQGFRAIGGKTKIPSVYSQAYRVREQKYTLEELMQYVPQEKRIDTDKIYKESKYTLEDAKRLYPEWYEKTILRKDTTRNLWDISGKVHGDNPFALYEWWKRQLERGASLHHRYFSIMALAIYGAKCGVPVETVRKDAFGYIEYMNLIAPTHKFTREDVKSALECYDLKYCTFPRSDIEKLTNIQIPPNKRNGRKQEEHMKVMRAIQSVTNPEWRQGNGRKSKADIVKQWRENNPNGSKSLCVKETGLSKPTVYKHWSVVE